MSDKNKAILLVLIIIVTLSLAFLYQGIAHHSRTIDQSISLADKKLKSTIISMEEFSFSPYKKRGFNLLSSNPSMVEAFAQRDRDLLYTLSLPEYQALKRENKYFRKMHFHLPDGTSFLRVHLPEDFGDNLKGVRLIIDEVHRTGLPLSGYEIGRRGPFFRVVEPIFFNDTYVGAMELGVWIHQLIETLKTQMHVEVTSFFKEAQWKMQADPLEIETVEFGNLRLVTHEKDIYRQLPKGLSLEEDTHQEVTFDGRVYVVHSHPIFKDFKGEIIGGIVLLHDITQEKAAKQNYIPRAVLFTLSLLALAMVGLYFTFDRLVSATFREVDERKRTEKHLEDSKALLLGLIDAIPDLISHKNREGVYLGCNNAFADFVGRDVKEVIGKTDFELFGKDKAEFYLEKDMAVLTRGESQHFEEWVEYADGRKVLIDTLKTPFRSADLRLLGVIGVSRDITERHRAEQQLRQSMEGWEKTLDAIPDIITLQDRDMRIVQANNAACAFFKMTKESFVGRKCYEVFRGAGEPCEGCPEIATLEDGGAHSGIIEHEGLGKTFLVSSSVIEDNPDGLHYLVHTAKDISEQKRLERELFHAQKMEALGTLAGGIAHDFNNILSAIIGCSEVAKLNLPAKSIVAGKIDQVLKAGHRAADLVGQILTFSQEADHHLQIFSPRPAIKDALKLLRVVIPKTIRIREELDHECGAIEAEPTKIHQIMMNLGTNALHAMEGGAGILTVRLYRKEFDEKSVVREKGLPPGSYTVLSVVDTGHGMDDDTLERIFDPYFTTKQMGKGTGLGMAVVHGIVQEYKGFVLVESIPGVGTSISIHFPTQNKEAAISNMPEHGVSFPKGNERILVVDDEIDILSVYQSVLEHCGYTVTVTTSSPDCLEKIRRDPDGYDLLIADQVMPDLPGSELAVEALKIARGLPIVLCTGHVSMISQEEAWEIGVKGFLRKPVKSNVLTEIVRKILDES